LQTINEQRNGQHSWGVAVIIHKLWPDCSRDLLLAALYHDVPEYITGDIPADCKWRFDELSTELSAAETEIIGDLGIPKPGHLPIKDYRRLKIADMLELMWFCLEEMQMGNTTIREVFNKGWDHLLTLELDAPSKRMLRDMTNEHH
tara:strand:- start:392 stop:829 length:438 start_codon:yes stop_codon:yes gene_type:complete